MFSQMEGRKCFNDALNTFYLRLYGVEHKKIIAKTYVTKSYYNICLRHNNKMLNL